MLLKVLSTDAMAKMFVETHMQAQCEGGNVYSLVGGGTDLVAVVTLPTEKILAFGKKDRKPKQFSLRRAEKLVGLLDLPSELSDCTLVLVLNADNLPKRRVFEIVPMLETETRPHIPRALWDRGGAVVYRQLPLERVVTPSVKQVDAAAVHYGTSALANLAELVATLKVGVRVGLPCVFDTYSYSYTAKYTFETMFEGLRAVVPAIADKIPQNFFLSMATAKAHSVCMDAQILKVLQDLGIYTVVDSPVDMATWYRAAQMEFAKRLMNVVGKQVPLEIVELAELMSLTTPMMTQAMALHNSARHSVCLVHGPNGQSVYTGHVSSHLQWATLESLHSQGYWAGGALIYHDAFALGGREGHVSLAYDGSKGNVNLMARSWMCEPHKLWIAPVGSFRISTRGSTAPIDPFVFLTMCERWGRSKETRILQQIWDACEAPLASSNIGKKTVVTVGLDGLSLG